MKPTLMVHEIREWMFDLPLKDYTLCFDDGLFSQYYYLDKLKAINTDKIFFISTGIICGEDEQQYLDFPDCITAHEEFFDRDNRRNYLKWSQVKEIHETPNCFIGGHSHNHNNYKNFALTSLYAELINDTEQMIKEFKLRGIRISKFCYPYNEQHILYESILKKHDIIEFYGRERLSIENLRLAR